MLSFSINLNILVLEIKKKLLYNRVLNSKLNRYDILSDVDKCWQMLTFEI